MNRLSKWILGLIALVFSSIPAMGQTQAPVRVNCGGGGYTDSKGQVWDADRGFNTGTTLSSSTRIRGTTDDTLFQTGRTNSSTSPLIYTFPVANGNYHVNLYFAETSNRLDRTGARIFNVKMNGNLAFQNLDIFATAGEDTALVEGVDVVVSNGQAVIEFDNVVRGALINAIEILPITGSSPALALNFVYPDGSPVAGSLSYIITSSLLSFRGSVPLVNGNAQAELLTSPAVLGLNTQFQVNLSLADTKGRTIWQFTLGMNPSQINLGAVKSSALKVVVNTQ